MSEQHSEHSEKSNPDEDDEEIEEINAPRIDRNLTYEPDLANVVINTACKLLSTQLHTILL